MFSKLKKSFLTILGDIKYYKYPMFLVYCPVTYRVKGKDYMDVARIIKPGDILVRGYSDYVDGLFIPGRYSHGALYVGDNQVIHAIAEGVSYINLIDFMRCDRLMVFRPKLSVVEKLAAVDRARYFVKAKIQYDFDFGENNSLYCFELVAEAYKGILDIQKVRIKKFFGLYNKEVYIADSIINNDKLEKIYECDPD